jgi:predicted TIM-barrel fold metal-dependent hydrolase
LTTSASRRSPRAAGSHGRGTCADWPRSRILQPSCPAWTEADWRHWKVADLRPYAEVALGAFGPARVMFGSDWPVCTLAASYPDVLAAAHDLTAGLSSAEHEVIFAGTARSVYGL